MAEISFSSILSGRRQIHKYNNEQAGNRPRPALLLIVAVCYGCGGVIYCTDAPLAVQFIVINSSSDSSTSVSLTNFFHRREEMLSCHRWNNDVGHK